MPDDSPAADFAHAIDSGRVLGLLVAVGADAFDAVVDGDAHAMLPLAGRSLIETQMARLVDAGVDAVHVVLLEAPAAAERHLGDGGRWGVPVTFHLVRDRTKAFAVPSRVDHDGDWLAVDCRCLAPLPTRPAIQTDADGRFTGTARCRGGRLATLAVGRRALGETAAAGWLNTPESLLETTSRLLAADGERFGIEPFADDCAERIRIGRNVRLHPQAIIEQPVVIGPDCDIGRGARIGPNVVLGPGCVLDDGAELRDAVVGARTYVGTGLDVEQSIVIGDRLAHARLGTTLRIQDRSLIDAIAPSGQKLALRATLMYLLGAMLFVLTRPLAAVVWPLRMRAEREGGATTPRRHFVCQFLPGLWDVVRGRRRLVGASGQVNTLWRGPVAPAGLVSESAIRLRPDAAPIDSLVADAHYAATAGLRRDLKLLGGYLRRVAVR